MSNKASAAGSTPQNSNSDLQTITVELKGFVSSSGSLNPQIKELILQVAGINLPRPINSFGNGRTSAITFPYLGDPRVTFKLQGNNGQSLVGKCLDLTPFIQSGQKSLDNLCIEFAPIIDGLLISISRSSTKADNITIRSYMDPQAAVQSAAQQKPPSSPQTPSSVYRPIYSQPKKPTQGTSQQQTPPGLQPQNGAQQHPHYNKQPSFPKYQTPSKELPSSNSSITATDRSGPKQGDHIYGGVNGVAVTVAQLAESPDNKENKATKPINAKSLKLVIKDGNGLSADGTDIYCEIYAPSVGMIVKTKSIPSGDEVQWNQTFHVPIVTDTLLKILVFTSKGSCIGSGTFQLPNEKATEDEVEIHRSTGFFGSTSITIAAKWSNKSPTEVPSASESPKTSLESACQLMTQWMENKIELSERYLPAELEEQLAGAQRLYVKVAEFRKTAGGAFEIPRVTCFVCLDGDRSLVNTKSMIEGKSRTMCDELIALPYDCQRFLGVVLVDLADYPVRIIGEGLIDLGPLRRLRSEPLRLDHFELYNSRQNEISGTASLALSLGFDPLEKAINLGNDHSEQLKDQEIIDALIQKPESSGCEFKVLSVEMFEVLNSSDRVIKDDPSRARLLVELSGLTRSAITQHLILPVDLSQSTSSRLVFTAHDEMDYSGEPHLRVSLETVDAGGHNRVVAKTRIDLEKHLKQGDETVEKHLSLRGPRNEKMSDELMTRLAFLRERSPVDATMLGTTLLNVGTMIGETIIRTAVRSEFKAEEKENRDQTEKADSPKKSVWADNMKQAPSPAASRYFFIEPTHLAMETQTPETKVEQLPKTLEFGLYCANGYDSVAIDELNWIPSSVGWESTLIQQAWVSLRFEEQDDTLEFRIGTSGDPSASQIIGKGKVEARELIAEYEDLGIMSEALEKTTELSSTFLSDLSLRAYVTYRVAPYDRQLSMEDDGGKESGNPIPWSQAFE